MLQPSIYLAAPFFSEVQLRVVSTFEKIIEDAGWKCQSPHRDGIFVKPDDPSERALEGFTWNVEMATKSTMLVAFIDWMCLPGREIREVSWPQLGDELYEMTWAKGLQRDLLCGPPTLKKPICFAQSHTPPLNITDVGTSFEIGLAFQAGVPIITVSRLNKPLNLMLIHAVIAHCTGDDALTILDICLRGLRPCGDDRQAIQQYAKQHFAELRHSGPIV